MRRLSATEAARRFSDLLDTIERTGETVVVERRGRPVASITPAPELSGRAVKELLGAHEADPGWAAELKELREGLRPEERSWSG
ncbi:MAG: type II toxin-antitoxin system Phd/YefM family antitoxin [Bauldia sp.]|nr:MAG: type II toxin-antitoxin system Phd/YefM family antitoxin [Bauldia sp.]